MAQQSDEVPRLLDKKVCVLRRPPSDQPRGATVTADEKCRPEVQQPQQLKGAAVAAAAQTCSSRGSSSKVQLRGAAAAAAQSPGLSCGFNS